MSDTFQKVADKYRSSPIAVVLFAAAFAMLVIGANNFAEDTYSSYLGLVSVEQRFGLNVQIFSWTYWLMSIAPQIATIVFFFMYLSTGQSKYLYMSFGAQVLDFGADIWYRSNGQLLDNVEVAAISGILTFLYFTFGSEFFITIGLGLVLKLWGPAIREYRKAWDDISSAIGGKPQQKEHRENRDERDGGEKKHIPFPASLPRGQSPVHMSGPKTNGGTGPLSPVSRENRPKSDNFRR